jgi:poly(A) polymerase
VPFTHLGQVVAEMTPIARAFHEAGHRVYLVGGVVRDLWLDLPVDPATDIDLTTDAVPVETKAIVGPIADAVWAQGERFGTIGFRVGRRDIEVTTHRSEAYTAESRKPYVAFATEIDTDLSRRDFTVNAMAIELPAGELVDPFSGVSDLAGGHLRTPLGAITAFSDDPLRMLRAARFAARYGLAPADDVVEAMTELAERLDIVAIERIRDELDKLLEVDDPGDAFLLLHETGLLRRVLPGVATALDRDDHAPLRAVARADPADDLARLAALAWWDSSDHRRSAVRAWSTRMRLPNAVAESLGAIVVGAATVGDALENVAASRRWAFRTGPQRQRALDLGLSVAHDAAHRLMGALDELAGAEDLDDPGVPLDGSDVMELLGIGPGPRVGEALAHLRALRFEQGPLSVPAARAALESLPLP